LPTKIAFVGEFPSDEDLVSGAPFSGPDGRTFNGMLRTANLERSDFLLTNVYDRQSEDDNVSTLMADKELTERSFARLKEELTRASPNVIIPMGPAALWAFTGQTAVTPYRGAQHPASRILPGAKLLPTYPPYFVRKQWKFLPVVVADLIKAARLAAQGPRLVYPQKTVIIRPIEDDVRAFLRMAVLAREISVDIETGWGQITSIQFSPWPYREGISIPFFDLTKPSRSYWGSTEAEFRVWREVEHVLEHPIPKLGQNFTYDVYWLLWKMGMRVTNYQYDTRLAHGALFPELPKDLAFMGNSYTDLGAWKQMGGRYSKEKREN
jgi:uracil-DNA glycosylase family 4